MLQFRVGLYLFFVCVLSGFTSFSQQLTLKAAGDAQNGYHVDIYNGKTLVVTNTEELSLQLFNHDLTTTATLAHLKGQKWTGNENMITLSSDFYVKEFDADLSLTVTYQVINANLVKKKRSIVAAIYARHVLYTAGNRQAGKYTTAICNFRGG
ncbi:hypothetical protein GALL_499300 [mine drainage metagenome]|uniref:Uncharacterized protein n=1 Tax=mine drainage metagenome TaxID=410659 RepID=A0A1J5PXX5_9ZZZZ